MFSTEGNIGKVRYCERKSLLCKFHTTAADFIFVLKLSEMKNGEARRQCSVKWALNNFIINYPGCPRFSVIYGANFRGWKNVNVQCCQFVYLCESCSY